MSDLSSISEPTQSQLTKESMKQASALIASLAERLAGDIEALAVPNGTGQATLRMFAAMIRSLNAPQVPDAAAPRNKDNKATTKRATSGPNAAVLH